MLDLGAQFIAGAFPQVGETPAVDHALPLELVRCDASASDDACGLVQMRHSVPGSYLYESYFYRSGINRTMTENLHQIATQAKNLARPQPGDIVLDIGCNDGTLFDGYGDEEFSFVGIDPSNVTRYAVAKGYEVVNDFFTATAYRTRYPDSQARIVTSIAMFYDLEDPPAFVADVASVLERGGVWVIELAYLPTMLTNNAFDTICHEHLEYYSFAVLERLLRDAGLEAVRAELNDVNGGSIRVFASHAGTLEPLPEDARTLKDLRRRESELGIESALPYEVFAENTRRVRDELRALVEAIKARGETLHVYGASTKGNTILQYCGIDSSLVAYAADRNPDKWGTETIATGIPIISEAESRAMKPDYYLALPWHFLDEFLEREVDFLERGGRFVVPLPEVRVVGKSGVESALTPGATAHSS